MVIPKDQYQFIYDFIPSFYLLDKIKLRNKDKKGNGQENQIKKYKKSELDEDGNPKDEPFELSDDNLLIRVIEDKITRLKGCENFKSFFALFQALKYTRSYVTHLKNKLKESEMKQHDMIDNLVTLRDLLEDNQKDMNQATEAKLVSIMGHYMQFMTYENYLLIEFNLVNILEQMFYLDTRQKILKPLDFSDYQ